MSRIDPPPGPRVSVSEMETRVARFDKLKGGDLCFMDQRIPGHEREMINLIGLGVTENESDPDLAPKIGPAHGFASGFAKCKPGCGAALHWHETEEIFMPLTGQWSIYWREGEEEREVILQPFDSVSVPIGIYRGFKNVSDEPATLMFIVGGPDTGKVHWHPSVIEAARATGIDVDDNGLLIELSEAERGAAE
jgi:quercetin dioxygenase-like cupin family protein